MLGYRDNTSTLTVDTALNLASGARTINSLRFDGGWILNLSPQDNRSISSYSLAKDIRAAGEL